MLFTPGPNIYAPFPGCMAKILLYPGYGRDTRPGD